MYTANYHGPLREALGSPVNRYGVCPRLIQGYLPALAHPFGGPLSLGKRDG